MELKPQPTLTIETGEITWHISVPYGVGRQVRSKAVRGVTINDDGSVRVEVDLGAIERALLFDCQVTWEGVTSNGQPVPYNPDLITQNMVPPSLLTSLAMQAVGYFFGEATPSSSPGRATGSEDDQSATRTTP